MLCLVEAVDLINEEDGAPPVTPALFRRRHHLFDFFNPGQDGAELDEVAARPVSHDRGQRRLPRTGRSPEDHGPELVALDLLPERLSRTEDVLLADKLFQSSGPHAVGQRPPVVRGGEVARQGFKEAHSGGLA